jgi:hypothetical protein
MKPSGDRKLWLCVGLAFGLLFCAWTVLFTLAARNRVASVPLATSGQTQAAPPASAPPPGVGAPDVTVSPR